MTTLDYTKVGLGLVGAIVLGYGMRVDDELIRWVGIAFLAVAVALRLFNKKQPTE